MYVRVPHTARQLTDAKQQLLTVLDWINAELGKIEKELRIPEVQGIQFEYLYAVPTKYQEGDLYYFAAGVPGSPGLFIRDSNSWRKL